ncbi:30S ribosomal protein S1 [bacterium]|nr:30S ribosomal protein S1 [bacterium]|tara:strand:- start:16804 stop:18063 length:1260 start_codon:yes stop_codon:yes gene_type:complete
MPLITSIFKKQKEKVEEKEAHLDKDEDIKTTAPLQADLSTQAEGAKILRKKTSPSATHTHPMVKIIEESKNPPEEGELVDGTVIEIDKSSLFVDLAPFGTGIIYGREFSNASDIIKKVNIGDTIAAKIIERENEDGYVELSLKEARQALIWNEAEEAIEKKTLLELPVKEANKGGLILVWQGIAGFLPASQLKTEHYPRVEDGDKDKILQELQKFVGQKIDVLILSASPKEGKLIFSEKGHEQKEKGEIIGKYNVGDIVEGEVTGIVDFGLFIKIEEGLEGLVHISEMDWGLVEDPRILFKVGEVVKAQIIEVKDNKISLSIKVLKENPWVTAAKKYKKGDDVTGVVIKHNKHGALVSIEEGVAGLNHVSEFGTEKALREELELGKTYSFKITLFEPNEQRMTLSHKETLKSTKTEDAT